jgi:hypothetical protein
MSIVGDGADTATTAAAQVDAGTGIDGAKKIPLGKQAIHPPSTVKTHAQVIKVRVRHRKQEEGEKKR